uniref:BRCA1-associated RING domain protein 1-like isoform X3 n=1 Tax=Crassostrea virginica TaxID=6565 RepID=A0A8B8C4M1_CRAVI|nr:BRCA1-associated RING domain protein 1-like isoform X3 [Crassostrea virginica]
MPTLNQTLKDLGNDLRCKACHSLAETPYVLGGCDHIYCSDCCQSLLDKSCVVCHIPVCVKEAKVDKLFCSLLNEYKQLSHILDNPETFHPDDEIGRSVLTSKQKQQASAITESVPINTDKKTKKQSTCTQSRGKRTKSIGTGDQTRRTQLLDDLEVHDRITGEVKDSVKAEKGEEKRTKEQFKRKDISRKTTAAKSLRIREVYAGDLIINGDYSNVPSDQTGIESKLELAKPAKALVPSEKKKARSSIGSNENVQRKTSRRSLPICGDLEKVKTLICSGANPNTQDNAGWTPLHEACHYGHLAISEQLLQSGSLVDVPGTDNETPLHDAVRHLRIQCVKLLVQYGASINARNIKGLTSMDLAGDNVELISALQTEAHSVTLPSSIQIDPLVYQSLCFLSTGLSRDQKILLQKCASKLQARIAEDFSSEVTHIVSTCNSSGLCPRTMKYLRGVLTGRWIVSMEWVKTCLEFGFKVCEEAFEIPGTSSDPESKAALGGRINRQHRLPGLFDGCQFYFSGNFEYPTPEKEELISLVKLGGGHVIQREPKPGQVPESDLTRPYHAPPDMATCCIYIVRDNTAECQPIKSPVMCSVKASWIMDCVSQFKLLSVVNERSL